MSSFQFLPWHYRDNKHLKIISLWHPPMHNLDENSVDVICTSWKLRGNFFFWKESILLFESVTYAKKNHKICKVSKLQNTIPWVVQLNNGMEEQWISHVSWISWDMRWQNILKNYYILSLNEKQKSHKMI